MTDIQHAGIPFSLEGIWVIEPIAFERLRELVAGSSHERLAAAATQAAGTTSPDTLYENSGGVAIIPFMGVVAKRPTIWQRIFGGAAVTTEATVRVNAAANDPAVKSILMLIDSPGGSVDGVGDLADTVAAANKVKPVTAYAQDRATSAAYWIGSQAGRFVGNANANIGSIGVFATVPDISRLVKNAGIEVNVVKSVNGKATGTAGTPVTDSQLSEVQRLVDATHQLFVSAVSRGRGKDMSSVADGRVHIGQDAVDLGLLDAIEPLSTTLSVMQEAVKPKPMMMMPKENQMADVTTITAPAAAAPDYSKQIAEFSSRLDTQSKELEALRNEKAVDAVIAAADPKKLTPGLMPAARLIAKNGGLTALNEFIASLPTIAPAGGSVTAPDAKTTATSDGLPVVRHTSDHVGGSLHAFDQKTAPFHQLAIAYQEKAELSGKKVSYRDAVTAVTRKTA